MKAFEMRELFEDQDGASLNPPVGFTQNKKSDVDKDVYTHTMDKLPTSYIASNGYNYELQGWYQGTTRPATLETSNPPSVTVDYTQPKSISDFDAEGQIHVVYAKTFLINEKYTDASNNSINSGAWDKSVPVAPNGTFNGAPCSY